MDDENKWASRKLVYALMGIILATVLLVLGYVGAEVWENVVNVISIGYLASQAAVDFRRKP